MVIYEKTVEAERVDGGSIASNIQEWSLMVCLICAGLQSCVQSESQGSDDGIGGLNWMETAGVQVPSVHV